MNRPRIRNLKMSLVVGALAVAVAIAGGSVLLYVHDLKARRTDNAMTVLEQCKQLELVKAAIRKSVQDSLTKLPTYAYYRTHPSELAAAIRNASDSIARFSPFDCYESPVVKSAGLRPPQK